MHYYLYLGKVVRTLCSVENDKPENRINDFKCDSSGVDVISTATSIVSHMLNVGHYGIVKWLPFYICMISFSLSSGSEEV